MEMLIQQIKTLEAQFQLAGERIFKLTKFSRKDVGEVMLSYLEELGELCQEIKIATGVAGTQHKRPGPDGIYGECADVWICAVSYCYAADIHPIQVGIAIITAVSPTEFTEFLIRSSSNVQNMQSYSMGLALHVDPDPVCFLNKINAKLDKWVKNVKYVE